MTRRRTRRPEARASDHGTVERMGHVPPDAVVTETAEAGSAGQVIATRRRIRPAYELLGLPDEQVDAARRFAADYEVAIWDARPPDERLAEDGKGPSLLPIIRSNVAITLPADAKLDAMARYGRAIVALGPCAHVVIAVVGEDYSLSEAALRLRRNRQELAGVLKVGLEALVKLDR